MGFGRLAWKGEWELLLLISVAAIYAEANGAWSGGVQVRQPDSGPGLVPRP